jgi:hypothetical protein
MAAPAAAAAASSSASAGQIAATVGTAGLDTLANVVSALAARRTRDLSVKMANTSHQREVADLRAAGLNPLLSVNSGAGTPNLPVPELRNTDVAGKFEKFIAAKGIQKEMEKKDADIAEVNEQIKAIREGVNTQLSQQKLNSAQALAQLANASLSESLKTKADAESNVANAQAASINADTHLKTFEAWKAAAQKGLYKGIPGKVLPWVDYMSDKLGNLLHFKVDLNKTNSERR